MRASQETLMWNSKNLRKEKELMTEREKELVQRLFEIVNVLDKTDLIYITGVANGLAIGSGRKDA